MASTLKVDTIQTNDGSGTIALQNQLSGMTTASLPALGSAQMPTGSVLQVKSLVYATDTSFTSSTFTNTGFSLAITPSSTSSKIYVMWQSEVTVQGDTTFGMRLLKDSTQIYEPFVGAGNFGSSNQHGHGYSFNFLDAPSTTSAITYTVQVKENSGGTIRCPAEGGDGTITLMEIAG